MSIFKYGDDTYSKFPLKDAHRLVDAIVEYCENLLKYLIVRPDGTISGASMAELEKMIGDGLKSTIWSLSRARLMLAQSLVREGIGKLRTRTEQDTMIRRAIRNAYTHFNRNAYRAIERYLSLVNSPLIVEAAGEAPLKSRSKAELSNKQSINSNKRFKYSKASRDTKRVKAIKTKIAQKVALTSADRKWKYQHKSLFQ